MSATGKTFEDLEERLEEMYAKVDCLIADNEGVPANSVCAEMERLALKETIEERKKFLENALKQHHAFRSAFEERVSVYLSDKVSEKKVSNIVSAPRTPRSQLAKLKLKHLEQKQRLEREMQEEMKTQQEEMNKQ